MPKDVLRQSDRITYSEDVKVNIGDYESRSVFLSYSTDVGESESIDVATKRARSYVRKKITTFEKRIRISSQSDVDFDTKAKLMREGW